MNEEPRRKAFSVVKDDAAASERSAQLSTHLQPAAQEGAALEPGTRDRRPILRWSIMITFAALVCLSLIAWTAHRAQNVLARNALVRGDITEVGARFSGTLASVEARPGDKVVAGQVLARLEDRHLRAQEAEMLAQIEALERQLLLERSAIAQDRDSRRVRFAEVDAKGAAALAEVAAARVRANEAREYRQARAALAAEGMISGEALREAQARVLLADESLAVVSAQARAAQSASQSAAVDLKGVAVREMQLDVLKAQADAAKGRLERVRADIESSVIRAPADSTVVFWMVKPGGSLDVGKPLVALSMGGALWIEAWIDEDDLGRVRIGSPAVVTLASRQGSELRGVVQRIGIATDYEHPVVAVPEPRASRMRTAPLVPVDIRLEGGTQALIPGLSAVVAIRSERSFLPFGQPATLPVVAR